MRLTDGHGLIAAPRISQDVSKVYHPRPDLITLRSFTRDTKLNLLQNLPQISHAARLRRA